MFLRWVAFAGLGGIVALGCGERAGDPIVARERAPTSSSAGGEAAEGDAAAGAGAALAAGTGGSAATDGGADAGNEPSLGPTGLCAPCDDSESCGDANDACIRHEGQSFCGRDCDEGLGCPDGYACVELDNISLFQCVPASGCATTTATTPSLEEIREYFFARINTARVASDRVPLGSSTCLDELAQASAIDYARTDEPLGKFVRECDPIWPNCECGWAAETEVAYAIYSLDWLTAVESAMSTERFTSSFLDDAVSDVGIGFWTSGDEAWIALSLR
jgi:hypothetical protein